MEISGREARGGGDRHRSDAACRLGNLDDHAALSEVASSSPSSRASAIGCLCGEDGGESGCDNRSVAMWMLPNLLKIARSFEVSDPLPTSAATGALSPIVLLVSPASAFPSFKRSAASES